MWRFRVWLERRRFGWIPPLAATGLFFVALSASAQGEPANFLAAFGFWILAVLVVGAAEVARPFLENSQKDDALAFAVYTLVLTFLTIAVPLTAIGYPVSIGSWFAAPTVVGTWLAGSLILRRRGGRPEEAWFHGAAAVAIALFLVRAALPVPDFLGGELPSLAAFSAALAAPIARTLYPQGKDVTASPPVVRANENEPVSLKG